MGVGIALIFLFFGVLWWFLGPVFADRRDRLWACALVGLSGGIEGLLKPLTHLLPDGLNRSFTEGVWHMNGWNTFQALFNPLWIAGLILLLVVLKPIIRPQGPAKPTSLRGNWSAGNRS